MRKLYAYLGNEVFGATLETKLGDAGYTRVEEVRNAEVVVTYFTNLSALENAYFDEGGVVEVAQPGTLLVDLSAETPMFARELFAIVDASKMLFAEAPLMVIDGCVSDAFADKDNVACFLAADEKATEEALPLIEQFAGAIHETTGTGSASMSRAAYTLQSVAALNAAAEADALYRAVRMMPAGMGEAAIGNAGAISPAADALLRAVDEGRYCGTYTVEMMMGELAAALTTAEEAGIALPQAETCLQLLEILAVIGGADKAPSVMAMAFRDQDEVEALGLDWHRAEELGETYARTHEDDEDDEDDYFDDYDLERADDLNIDRLEAVEQDEVARAADDEEDYGFYDDDPGYDDNDRDYVELADQEDYDFDDD